MFKLIPYDQDYYRPFVHYINNKWEKINYPDVKKRPVFHRFNNLSFFYFKSIIDTFNDSQVSEYSDYKILFEMMNIDLKYDDECLYFIFNELKEAFK